MILSRLRDLNGAAEYVPTSAIARQLNDEFSASDTYKTLHTFMRRYGLVTRKLAAPGKEAGWKLTAFGEVALQKHYTEKEEYFW